MYFLEKVMENDRTQIWSCGGGVQSTAIAALICLGELKPDLAVISDTEREGSATWAYLDNYIIPSLQKVNIILHRIKKSDYATVDLFGGKEKQDLLIPVHFVTDGKPGKLPIFCSNEWKTRVIHRWASDQGVKKADIWIGFTIDELKRVKTPIGKWQHKFPLIEKRMTRGDCIALADRMGWPEPPRSSCWMCPNRTHTDWRWLKENSPADFIKAIEFEKEIRKHDPDFYLTDKMTTLDNADLSKEDDLFDTGKCDSGMCFV